MRHVLLIAVLLLAIGCGEDSDNNGSTNGITTSPDTSPVCDGDELTSSRQACEAEGCVYLSGAALDDECAVLSQTLGTCISPDSDTIGGPVLVVSGETVYLYEDGAPQGSMLCGDQTLPACSCPVN